MHFDDEDIKEFVVEASELLDDSERRLLSIDKGGEFSSQFDAIFRAFHSLKGGAGMLGMTVLQNHMHIIESLFAKLKGLNSITKEDITLFLEAIDASREMMNGKTVEFKYPSEGGTTPAHSIPKPPPLPVAAPQENNAPKMAESVATQDNKNTLVYVIDDEPDVLNEIAAELEFLKFKCRTFSEASDLFAAVKDAPPDLVLTDIRMPKISGLDVLREVKRMDPDIPVIFVSGFLTKEVLMESLELGIFSAIEKPFDSKILLTQVQNATRQRVILKYFNKSINLVLYQFSDLDQFLADQGKEDIRKTLRRDIDLLIGYRRSLRKNPK